MRSAVAVALLAAAFVVACERDGGGENMAAVTTTQPVRHSATSESSAWDRYRGNRGGTVRSESPPQGAGEGARRALARLDDERRLVEVAELEGAAWTTIAEIVLPPPAFELAAAPIQAGDVTGDGRTDYLVMLQSTQHVGVVVTADGGRWRAVPVRGVGGELTGPYVGVNPRIEEGALVSDERVCEPTCADGPTRSVSWRYADGELRSGDAERSR